MTFDPSSLKEAYRAQFGGNGMFTIGLMDTESPTPQEPYLSTTSSDNAPANRCPSHSPHDRPGAARTDRPRFDR